jgi:hypothetical protein
MCSRFAVHAFGLSLIGMVLSFGYQFFGAEPMPGAPEGAAVMPIVIVVLGLLLLWYATAMRKKGVLR